MIEIIIPKEKRLELTGMGHARNAAKEPEWSRRKSDVFADNELDAHGMWGEYAAGSYLGVDVDAEITRNGDGGRDLFWRNKKVAVKFNHRDGGFLMVEGRPGDDIFNGVMKDFPEDVSIIISTTGKCVLPGQCICRKEGDIVVTMAGWLTREQFLNSMFKKDLGLGPRYICRTCQLNPMEEIWNLV